MISKSLLLLLPFVSSLCWAATYAMNEEAYKTLTIPTLLVMINFFCVLAGVMSVFLLNEKIDFTPFFTHPQKYLFWAIPLIAGVGSIALHLSVRTLNPTYTAILESSYIIFVPLFAWLLFGHKQWNTATLIGGALILSGVAIIVFDKARQNHIAGV